MICSRLFIMAITMLLISVPLSTAQESSVADRPLAEKTEQLKPLGEIQDRQTRELQREQFHDRKFFGAMTPEDKVWWEQVREKCDERAWLGVQLAPVSAALASHLGLKKEGLMIRNIFVDSPADQAGLQRYDVIIKANDKSVEADVAAFAKHIRNHQPGTSIELTFYRKGKIQKAAAELSERPRYWDKLELKYEEDPDVFHWRDFGLRGKILRPAPEGGWELEDLGDIPEEWGVREWVERLPEYFAEKDEYKVNEARRVDKDGKVLHVQQKEDGTIVVKRYSNKESNKKVEVKVYDNLQELRKADPDAHKFLQSVRRKPHTYQWRRWGYDRNDWPFRQILPPEHADKKWQEWRDRFFQGPMEELKRKAKPLYPSIPHPKQNHQPPLEPTPLPEPKIHFEVTPKGEINVYVRDKDAELNMTFKTQEALKDYSPKLYNQYQELKKKLR